MLDVLKQSPNAANGSSRGMQRLQFELALDLAGPGDRPLAETLRRAAETVDAELLFVLPAVEDRGETGVVLLDDEESDRFMQVESRDTGFAISDETQMDDVLLALARSSVEVLEQILEDDAVRQTFDAPSELLKSA